MARRPRHPAPPPPPPPPTSQTVTGTSGNDRIGAGFDVPQFISGLGGNDFLSGSTKADVIDGGDGNDFLFDGDLSATSGFGPQGARGANDRLLGGAGDDYIESSFGADVIDGGAGSDYAAVFLTHVAGNVTVNGVIGQGNTALFSNGTLVSNVEELRVHVGDGDNVLTLSGGDIAIYTGGGNNRITTGDGNDNLQGSGGDDIFHGGGGADTLGGSGGNNQLFGGDGDDVLLGTGFLDGGAGNDLLYGGTLSTMVGGSGADTFLTRLDTVGGFERILDFNYAQGDRIDLQVIIGFDSDGAGALLSNDPVGEGLVSFVQRADGVALTLTGNPGGGLLLVGASLDLLPVDFVF